MSKSNQNTPHLKKIAENSVRKVMARRSSEKMRNINFTAELTPQEEKLLQQSRVKDTSRLLERLEQSGKLPTDPQIRQSYSDGIVEEESKRLQNYYSTTLKAETLKNANSQARSAPPSLEPIQEPVQANADERRFEQIGQDIGTGVGGAAVIVGSGNIRSFNSETKAPTSGKQAGKYYLTDSAPETTKLLRALARKKVYNQRPIGRYNLPPTGLSTN